jgi:hypothetical protein
MRVVIEVRNHGVRAFSANACEGLHSSSGMTQEEAVDNLKRKLPADVLRDVVEVKVIAARYHEEPVDFRPKSEFE